MNALSDSPIYDFRLYDASKAMSIQSLLLFTKVAYSTWCYDVVTHLSTAQAHRNFTPVFWWEQMLSTWLTEDLIY